MARERVVGNREADRHQREKRGAQPVREEQTGRQADTIIGASRWEAGGNKERKEKSQVSRERKENRRCRQAEEELDKRENQANEQIHMQSTLKRMMNVCTGDAHGHL